MFDTMNVASAGCRSRQRETILLIVVRHKHIVHRAFGNSNRLVFAHHTIPRQSNSDSSNDNQLTLTRLVLHL